MNPPLARRATPARLLRDHQYLSQWVVAVLFLVLLALSQGGNLYLSYRNTERDAHAQLMTQARVIERNLNYQLYLTDKILRHLRQGASSLHAQQLLPHLNTNLEEHLNTMQGLRNLVIVNRDGTVVAASHRDLIGLQVQTRVSFSKAARERDPAMLYVSPPFRSRRDGAYTISLSRTIQDRSGHFAGVVIASLDTNYFQTLLSSVLYTSDMWSALVHSDGRLFLLMPQRSQSLPRLPEAGPDVQMLRVPLDGSVRLVAQSTVQPAQLRMDKSLIVLVGRDLDQALQPWREDLRNQLLIYAVVAALTMGGLLLLQRRQRRLEQLNADHRLILDSAGEGVVGLDSQGRLSYTNHAARRLVGWEQLPELLDWLAQRAAPLAQLISQALEDGKAQTREEIPLPTAGGGQAMVSLTLTPTREEGHISGVVLVFRDIHDRLQAEQALRQSATRLRLATEAAGVGVWEYEVTSGRLDWDDNMLAIYGKSRADFRSTYQEWLDTILPEEALQTHRAVQSAAASDGLLNLRFRIGRSDGRIRAIHTKGQAIRDQEGRAVRFIGTAEDVTEEEEAQAALREAEERFRSALESAAIGMALVGIDGRFMQVNAALVGIVGYSAEELYRLTVQDITHADDLDDDLKLLTELDAGLRDSYHMEKRYLHKSGHSVWVRLSVSAVRDMLGRPLYYIAQSQDISEEKQTLALLQRERQRLANILEGTHVGTWEWNIQTGELRLDTRWANLVGYELEELEPVSIATWEQLAHPEDLDHMQAMLTQHRPGDSDLCECESRWRHRDGHWVWALGRGRVWSWTADGEPEWVSGTHMDVTARRLAQESLRRTTALLRSVLDSASEVSIIATDLEGTITLFNQGAEHLLGYQAEEMIACCTPLVLHLPEEIAARGRELSSELGRPVEGFEVLIAQSLRQGAEQREWTYRRRDGSCFTVSLIVTAMHSTDDELIGYLGIGHDVTGRKEYEAWLQAEKHQAEQVSQAKSQFLANMSHEIRTPMNAILGMLQLIQQTGLDVRQRDYADKAEVAARTLLGILNDILDFSKVEAGKITLETYAFDLDNLLCDLGVILTPGIGHKPVELLYDVAPDLPRRLIGDALRLQQVLLNLAGNAIKFTERGEVVLSLRQVGNDAKTVQLRFSVRDTGIGIDQEQQRHIFDSFTQAESSTTRRFGGTGLGLAISQRLVRLMGGELTLVSAPGQGSEFSFTLPLLIDHQAPPPQPLPQAALTSPRVLIVDDNDTARELLAAMATSLGWEVTAVADGEQGLAEVAAAREAGQPYRAVFIDWDMPSPDGWETARSLRRQSGEAPLIIMVTAHGRDMLARYQQQAPALFDGFLFKPVTASMMVSAMAGGAAPAPVRHGGRLQRLAGLRILVVEDNPTNQQVAQELLSQQGAEVMVAGDGRSGITAVEQAQPPFDLILMDIQMPDMDGYSATREIRRRFDATALPIIAMTANAMSSDRDACLAAGMNDHVGKPIDLAHLLATIEHHIGRGPGPVLPPSGDTQPAVIDTAAALNRLGGDAALYDRLVESFRHDTASLPDKLAQALEQTERRPAIDLLHTLKGLAATVGANRLASLAAMEEARFKSGITLDPAERRQLVATIRQAIDEASAGLIELAPAGVNLSPVLEGVAVDDELRSLLDTLASLLAGANMRALELHRQLQQRYGALLGEAAYPLDQAMVRLDFGAAHAACQDLLARFFAI
ncbi:PAS domain S-box protein [Chitinimonas lacunae]|uniref:histidine kinase n=1 Tax=Chitinimonas lacunae TaxID=1963018 RepID=A0ABV8MLM5_9NEIS